VAALTIGIDQEENASARKDVREIDRPEREVKVKMEKFEVDFNFNDRMLGRRLPLVKI